MRASGSARGPSCGPQPGEPGPGGGTHEAPGTRPRAPSQVNLVPRNLTGPLRGTERGGGGLPNPPEVLRVYFGSEMSCHKGGPPLTRGEGVSSPENGFQGTSWYTHRKAAAPGEPDLEGGARGRSQAVARRVCAAAVEAARPPAIRAAAVEASCARGGARAWGGASPSPALTRRLGAEGCGRAGSVTRGAGPRRRRERR